MLGEQVENLPLISSPPTRDAKVEHLISLSKEFQIITGQCESAMMACLHGKHVVPSINGRNCDYDLGIRNDRSLEQIDLSLWVPYK